MFKNEKGAILVDCYAVELYLPSEYMNSAYRGTGYYSVLGTKIKFIGIGNFRLFKSEKEYKNPESVKTHPFGIPMMLMTIPSEIEVRDVQFVAGGVSRNCIVLTYFKGDTFIASSEVIKDSDPVMIALSRLEQGKLDHIPPEVAVSILRDAEIMNGLSLRIPPEEEEIFVAERYRDPSRPSRAYRYYTGKEETDKIVSYNMRTDAMKMSTFSAVMHEDINTSMITAINRKRRNEYDTPGAFEATLRGLNMDAYKAADQGQFSSTKRSEPEPEKDYEPEIKDDETEEA